MNIYVSNLSYNTTDESLQQLFAEYGETTSAKVITDRETGRSRGFGFVEMTHDKDGQSAIDDLNGTEFEGKQINVSIARPKPQRNGSGYNKRRY
jgi:RNA recognition motif-containing protein